MPLDLSNDYLVFDGMEPVQFISARKPAAAVTTAQQAAGYGQPQSVAAALRRALSVKELAASGGVYSGQDIVWLLPAKLVLAAVPKPGDFVIDKFATMFTVLQADFQSLRSMWKLTTRNLVLAGSLYDTIDVYGAGNEADAAAGRIPAGILKYAAVPARVQEVGSEAVDERGGRFTRRTFDVPVGLRVDVRPGEDWFTFGGQVYEITATSNPDRIDELQRLAAVLKP